jgi:hypothetical protein
MNPIRNSRLAQASRKIEPRKTARGKTAPRRFLPGVLLLAGTLLVTWPAISALVPSSLPGPGPSVALAASEDARFEKLRSLAGTWVGLAGFGQPTDSTVVTYRVTGGGNVVMEILFEGTPHEMVTMYHRDGDDLLLTHYCGAGNQPRMKAEKGDDPSVIRFDFTGASNLASPNDMHMHSAVIRFVDADHVQSTWTSYQGGKPAGEAKFDLHRKK